MSVEQIMTQKVVTVEIDDSLSVVKEIFEHTHFHHLLVVESELLFGIISDRDLLKVISPYIGTIAETSRDIATLDKRAHHIRSSWKMPPNIQQPVPYTLIKQSPQSLPFLKLSLP